MRIFLILFLASLNAVLAAPSLIVSNLTIQGRMTGYEPNGTNDTNWAGLTLASGNLDIGSGAFLFNPGSRTLSLNGPFTLSVAGGNYYFDSLGGAWINRLRLNYANGDVILERDAPNTLAQRNGTAAQTNRIYGTYVDASNYSLFQIGRNNVGTYFENLAAGSGVAGDFNFNGNIKSSQVFGESAVYGGALYCYTDSAGGKVGITSQTLGVMNLIPWSGTDMRVNIGGTTASFPALKRNATAINFRLADDSADAPITFSTATASGDITFSDNSEGPVVRSPDGNRWRLQVSNAGVISAVDLDP